MWPERVVLVPPAFDQHLGLQQGLEDLSIQALIAQLAEHNAERFDVPFLHAWYRRQQIFCPARYMALCTKQKALWLFAEDKTLTPPPDFKLGTLCHYFGIRLGEDEAHDAVNDVRATVQLYAAMRMHERQLAAKVA